MNDLTNAVDPSEAVQQLSMSDIISPYIGVFFVAWVVTILVTPLMRRVAIYKKIVDWPDDERKNHGQPVPYLGGVAIFIGWLAGIFLYFWISPHLPAKYQLTAFTFFPISIVFGAVIITITGLVDDVYGISPRVKLGFQIIAAAMVAQTDLGTQLVGDTVRALGLADIAIIEQWLAISYGPAYWLGMVIIAMFIIGGCNSVNLLDGLDGLAAGVLSIACFGFLIITCFIAIQIGDPADQVMDHLEGTPAAATMRAHLWSPVRVVMCLSVLGALLGFLPHNFNPAHIFMGDAGSLLLGYLCATTMLLFAHAPGAAGPVMVSSALIVFALPIADTALAIFRRLMSRRAIYAGDNQHLHHQLMNAFSGMGLGPNLSIKLAVVTMYGLSLVFAALGCALLYYTRWRFVLAVLLVLFGFVLVAGYKAGQRHYLLTKTAPPDIEQDLITNGQDVPTSSGS